MAILTISLPADLKDWVEEQVVSGAYANASDYVKGLIREDKERAEGLHTLQAAITFGTESGTPTHFDPVAFKLHMRDT